jgi:biotin transport system substrate-specific component
LIHGLGLLQLGMWLSLVKEKSFSLWQLLWMGTIPFIAGDLTKAAAAAIVARAVSPKIAYNGEVDRDKKFWRIP